MLQPCFAPTLPRSRSYQTRHLAGSPRSRGSPSSALLKHLSGPITSTHAIHFYWPSSQRMNCSAEISFQPALLTARAFRPLSSSWTRETSSVADSSCRHPATPIAGSWLTGWSSIHALTIYHRAATGRARSLSIRKEDPRCLASHARELVLRGTWHLVLAIIVQHS